MNTILLTAVALLTLTALTVAIGKLHERARRRDHRNYLTGDLRDQVKFMLSSPSFQDQNRPYVVVAQTRPVALLANNQLSA